MKKSPQRVRKVTKKLWTYFYGRSIFTNVTQKRVRVFFLKKDALKKSKELGIKVVPLTVTYTLPAKRRKNL
jgi:hypothetical protein